MAPPASFSTTIRKPGSDSPEPRSRPPASCRKVTSPSSSVVSWRPPRAIPVAVEMVPSIPARPRLAKTVAAGSAAGRPARSTSRMPLEDPSINWPRACCQTRAPTDGPVAVGSAARTPSRACCAAAPASSQVSSQSDGPRPAKSARSARFSSGSSVRRPGWYQATGTGWYSADGTSARSRSAATGRDSVGRPNTTTLSMGCADDGPKCSSKSRYGPTAFGPKRALDEGSASSGRPWARANASATGPASCPASTTVRRSSSEAAAGGRFMVSGSVPIRNR